MSKSIRQFVWCAAFSGLFGLLMPITASAAGQGPRGGNGGPGRSGGTAGHVVQNQNRVDIHSQVDIGARKKTQGGPLSYNAYWKAANSPNPPRANQGYNVYWQKMQAWQGYHQPHN